MFIKDIKINGLIEPIYLTDSFPLISWQVDGEMENDFQKGYEISLFEDNIKVFSSGKIESEISEAKLSHNFLPYKNYDINLTIYSTHNEKCNKSIKFYSGKINEPFSAQWISSGVTNVNNSLPEETFVKKITLDNIPNSAYIFLSALGIYDLYINGIIVNKEFFLPGYTNYKKHVQYQFFDIRKFLKLGENLIEIKVNNGWYLGTIGNKINNYGNKRAIIAEIRLDDLIICSDESWKVHFDDEVRYGDFYNGEIIDKRKKGIYLKQVYKFDEFVPKLITSFGSFVYEHEHLKPILITKEKNKYIYDFKQNFVGIIKIKIKANKETEITIRHAEILTNGDLFTKNLRSAKQTLRLFSVKGENVFEPRSTYMGFRYIEIVSNNEIEIVSLEGVALYSNIEISGTFKSDNELLNQLQSNIVWENDQIL